MLWFLIGLAAGILIGMLVMGLTATLSRHDLIDRIEELETRLEKTGEQES